MRKLVLVFVGLIVGLQQQFVVAQPSCDLKRMHEVVGVQQSGYVGYSVAISGDGMRAVVGVPGFDNDIGTNVGKVLIYEWNGSSWELSDSLIGSEDGQFFGTSVSINADGSIIAVGGPYWIPGYFPSITFGRVFIYKWNGNTWTLLDSLMSIEKTSSFGFAVSISPDGNYLVVGEHEYGTDIGKVNIYKWNGSSWILQDTIVGWQDYERLGRSVSISDNGDRLVIGAPTYDSGGVSNVGKVLIYQKLGNKWELMDSILGSQSNEELGYSVDISADGNRVVIGSPKYDVEGLSDAGKVFIYDWDGLSWQLVDTMVVYDDLANLGYSVAVSDNGRRIALGAPRYSIGGEVLVYEWNGIEWQLLGRKGGSNLLGWFGSSVNIDGNGTRIIVGSYRYPDFQGLGKATIYECGSTTFVVSTDQTDNSRIVVTTEKLIIRNISNNAVVQLIDLIGRKANVPIYRDDKGIVIEISGLPEGVYVVVIHQRSEGRNTKSFKFIKIN